MEQRATNMSAGGNDAKGPGSAPQEPQVDKVRDLIRQIKSHDATKAHEEELETHVSAIEEELDRDKPHPSRLASLLEGLRTLSAEATEALMKSGTMTLLNEILGTGVPPV
jgi:hypothetical protein